MAAGGGCGEWRAAGRVGRRRTKEAAIYGLPNLVKATVSKVLFVYDKVVNFGRVGRRRTKEARARRRRRRVGRLDDAHARGAGLGTREGGAALHALRRCWHCGGGFLVRGFRCVCEDGDFGNAAPGTAERQAQGAFACAAGQAYVRVRIPCGRTSKGGLRRSSE
jgi:hypothetical protein